MGFNITKATRILPHIVQSSVPASTATLYGTKVDMTGYDGCAFVALFTSSGASTAGITNTMKVYQCDTTSPAVTTTSYTLIAGTSAYLSTGTTAGGQKMLMCEVYRPRKRFLSARITAGMAERYAAVSIQYGGRVQPTTGSTTWESNASLVMTTA